MVNDPLVDPTVSISYRPDHADIVEMSTPLTYHFIFARNSFDAGCPQLPSEALAVMVGLITVGVRDLSGSYSGRAAL